MRQVILGIERLKELHPSWLEEARIGLLINQASVDPSFRPTRAIVAELAGRNLRALFSPQHGIKGEAQANMVETEDEIDPDLKVPIYSLYSRETRTPTEEMLARIDCLLIDLQDVGTRVYTFATTMGLCLEAAAQYKKKVVVLDRPNPINAEQVEGNVLKEKLRSFVGYHPLPMRHGMTMGELAQFFNTERRIGADLEIIPMEGYKREHLFPDTGLPWVPPSPNMLTPATALAYPGQVLLEGTNLSEGRGTPKPFECLGAPYIDSRLLRQRLENRKLPGCCFQETSFTPHFDKWKGELCHGLQIQVTDPRAYKPFYTTLAIIQEIMTAWPDAFSWLPPPYEYEFERLPIDIITGDEVIRKGLEQGIDLDELEAGWQGELEGFLAIRRQYLLY
ncbi:MAG: hypothetical protein A2Y65_02785 [Deltaproteobacteria bacterium RBG_13_52_11]|nr:MAG: hypothetical protein A2Y65_02785 [Deltaproteobacteria bacterium RBG_13_52_11]